MSSGLGLKARIKNIFFSLLESLAPLLDKGNKSLAHSEVRKILVAEGGGIGDLIRVFPAIECLKNNFPDATISVLASPEAKVILALFSQKDIISEVLDYDLKDMHRGFFGKVSAGFFFKKKTF